VYALRRATAISLLVVLGVRHDGQKVLLTVHNMGGESEAAWQMMLDDLVKCGLQKPDLAIVDGAPGLDKSFICGRIVLSSAARCTSSVI